KEYKGCPDSDGDGIEDRKDECPLEACPNGEETDEYYCVNGCKVMKEKVETVVEEPVEEIEEPTVITIEDVNFNFDKFDLTSDGLQKAKETAELISKEDGDYFVDGFTGSVATEPYNMKLSERRAQTVKDALIKEGVDPN